MRGLALQLAELGRNLGVLDPGRLDEYRQALRKYEKLLTVSPPED